MGKGRILYIIVLKGPRKRENRSRAKGLNHFQKALGGDTLVPVRGERKCAPKRRSRGAR